MNPPKAKRILQTKGNLKQTVEDPYMWLQDRDAKEVLAHLKLENKYTDHCLNDMDQKKSEIFEELKGRLQPHTEGVPAKDGEYEYFERYIPDHEHLQYCRKAVGSETVEVCLDLNIIAKEHDYVEVGAYNWSPNHKYLAYTLDLSGDEDYQLIIKDLTTGKLLSETRHKTHDSIAWARDSQSFYYTAINEKMRPWQVFKHNLNEDFNKDEKVFEEQDAQFWIDLEETLYSRYLILNSSSHTSSEVYVLDFDMQTPEFKCFNKRTPNLEYDIVPHHEGFFVLTNQDHKNFSVKKYDPDWNYLGEYYTGCDTQFLHTLICFKNYVVLGFLENGIDNIRVDKLKENKTHIVELPEPVYDVDIDDNFEYDTHLLRFTYSSLTTPRITYDYDLESESLIIRKQVQIPSGYNKNFYTCERKYARTSDNIKIPISLVYRNDVIENKTAPLILKGYGAYGDCYEPYFDSDYISLLDRGFVIAIAHVRGGGENGKAWHDDGRLKKKMNSFFDFIACAEFLIDSKMTQRGEIVADGSSAGGLLVGAALNLRPELFRAAICNVPFVDCLTTMLNPNNPLTELEYDEWGDPNEDEYFEEIKNYSPYENIKPQDYPHIFAFTAMNDMRVEYWESAKWIARLRETKTDSNLCLLKVAFDEGHSGSSGRFESLKETAEIYAFILKCFKFKGTVP